MLWSKLFAIGVSFLILGNAYLIKRKTKTWIAPGCVFSVFWFLYSFIPLVVEFNIPISIQPLLYILAMCIVFSLSTLFFNWDYALECSAKNSVNFAEDRWKLLYFCFILLQTIALLSIIFNLNLQGYSLSQYVEAPRAMVHQYMMLRYSNKFIPNIYFETGTILNYVGAILGALCLPYQQKKINKTFTLLLIFLPSILFMLIYADKGTILLVLAFFYGAILSARVRQGQYLLLTKKSLLYLVCIGGLLSLLLSIAFISRVQSSGPAIFPILHHYFASYALGHLYAFSNWYMYHVTGVFQGHIYFEGPGGVLNKGVYLPMLNTSVGYYTFVALYKLLDISKDIQLPLGLYAEYYIYGKMITTNIFTIFRGLIVDFGLYGAFLAVFLFGLFFNVCFYLLLRTKGSIIAVVGYVFMWGFIYTTFLASLLVWGSVYLVFCLLLLVLAANKYIRVNCFTL